MNRVLYSVVIGLAVALLCVGACSGDDEMEDMGTLRVEATIDPSPPIVGQNTMTIELFDADDLPLAGATLVVDPQMPAHGHGSPETAVVTDMGGGVYEAFPVTLSMPGMWEVTVHASMGEEHGMKMFELTAQ